MAEQPLPKRIRRFVCFHLGDRHAFAGFGGQDFSAWHAFVYLVELYGRGDSRGQERAIEAMRACVAAAQRKDDVLACFKKAIPGVLDWGYEARVWTLIAPEVSLTDVERDFAATVDAKARRISMPCADGERVCPHLHSKPSAKHPGWFICKDPLCKTEWKLDDDGGSVVCPV